MCEDGSSGTKVCSEEYAWNSCQCDGSAGDKGNHSGTLKFSMVDAGTEHACGILKSSGEVRCWGANDKGQSDAPPGEFADVAAWLATLASIAGVDLEQAVRCQYAHGCPKCGQTPCVCECD